MADPGFRPHRDDRHRICVISSRQKELSKSPCGLCRLIAFIKPSTLHYTLCWLTAKSSISLDVIYNGLSVYNDKFTNCPYLTIELDNNTQNSPRDLTDHQLSLAFLRDGNAGYVGTRKIDAYTVEYAFVKESLQWCLDNHPQCRDGGLDLSFELRVLDCGSRQIVPAPQKCKCLALSYVWGEVVEGSTLQTAGNTSFAPVVLDTIRLTLNLGERYLWVDRLVNL